MNSAQDDIVDEAYRNGQLSTEDYTENLQERLGRSYLTPLQQVNLNQKIENVRLDAEDQKVEAAYKLGTDYNGTPVDDKFMLQWEAARLDSMVAGTPAYQEQTVKLQGMVDSFEKGQRSDYRRQKLLEISKMPENRADTLQAKINMYHDLIAAAEGDGDLEQVESMITTVNGLVKTMQKYEFTQAEYEASQQIEEAYKSGASIQEAVNIPFAEQEAIQPQTEGALPTEFAEEGAELPSFENIIGDIAELDLNDPTQYLRGDDANNVQSLIDSIQKTQNTVNEYTVSAQKFLEKANVDYQLADAAWEKGLDDTAEKYERSAKTNEDKAQDLSSRASEQQVIADDKLSEIETVYQKAVTASIADIVNDKQSNINLNKSELENYMKTGELDEGLGIPIEQVKDSYVYMMAEYLKAEKWLSDWKVQVFTEFVDDPEIVRAETINSNKYAEDIAKWELWKSNPDNMELVTNLSTGLAEPKDVSDQLIVDEDGITNFNKLHAPIGYIFSPVTYTKKGGEIVSDGTVKNTSVDDLGTWDANVPFFYSQVYVDENGNEAIRRNEETIKMNTELSTNPDGTVGIEYKFNQEQGDFDTMNPIVRKMLEGWQTVREKILGAPEQAGETVQQAVDFMAPGVDKMQNVMGDTFTPQPAYAEELPQSRISAVPEEYQDMVRAAAERTGLRESLIAAVIMNESSWNPSAVNEGGDRGLGQINPIAFPNVTDEQAYDPQFAIDFMADTIAGYVAETGDEGTAIAMYHTGRTGFEQDPDRAWSYMDRIYEIENERYPEIPDIPQPQQSLQEQPLVYNKDPGVDGGMRYPSTPQEPWEMAEGGQRVLEMGPGIEYDNLRSQQPPAYTPTSNLRSFYDSVAQPVRDFAEDIPSYVDTVGQNLQAAGDFITQPDTQSNVQDYLAPLITPGSGAYNTLDTISNIGSGISNVVTGAAGNLRSWYDEAKKNVSGFFNNLF